MLSRNSVLFALSTLVSLAGLGFSKANQVFTPEQRQAIDAALPAVAPAKPKQPRRLLVVNLQVRNGAPVQGEMSIKVDDPTSPVTAMFAGKTFVIRDQAFQLQEPSLRDRLHVLLSIDVNGTVAPRRQFFKTRVEDKDFPMSWIKPHGKGRVFYSAFGHSDYTSWNPTMLQHFLAGIQYALGDLNADDKPSAQVRR